MHQGGEEGRGRQKIPAKRDDLPIYLSRKEEPPPPRPSLEYRLCVKGGGWVDIYMVLK